MANSDSGRAGTDGGEAMLRSAQARLERRRAAELERKAAAQPARGNLGAALQAGAVRGKSAQPAARGKSAAGKSARGKSARGKSAAVKSARGKLAQPDTAAPGRPLCAADWIAFETLRAQSLQRAGALPGAPPVAGGDAEDAAAAVQWADSSKAALQSAVEGESIAAASAAAAVQEARALGADAAAVADWLGADISPDGAGAAAIANWRAVIAESWARRSFWEVMHGADAALRAAALDVALQAAAVPAPSLDAALRSAPELVLHICARDVWAELCEGYRNRPKRKLRAARGKNGHVLVRNSAAAAGMTLAQAGAQYPISPGGALTIDGHAFRKDNAVACVIPPWEQRKILAASPLQLSLSSGAGGPDRLQNPLSIQVESAMALRGIDGRLARRVTLAVFILDALASAAQTPGLVVPADIARALWPNAPRIEESHYRKLTTILGILRGLDCYVPEFNSRGKRVWREWRLFSTLSPAKGEATGLLDPHSPIYVATEESVLRPAVGAALFDLTGAAQLSSALAQRLYLLGALAVNVQGGVLRKDSAGRWQVNSAAHWECDFDELALRLGMDGSGRKGRLFLRRALEIVCGGGGDSLLSAKSGQHGEVSLGAGPLLLEAYAGRCADGGYDYLPPVGPDTAAGE